MANFVIGIGGTGAKCIESMIYLGAAGLFPKENVNLLFLDPDQSNGTLTRVRNLLEGIYVDCCKMDTGKDSNIFRLKPVSVDSWSPLTANQQALSHLFRYDLMDNEIKDLFNVLYTPAEIRTDLSVGFKGHPSIGAAVLANISNSDVGPLNRLLTAATNLALTGEEVKIFLCGSIFGGTGAAGVPTIAKLLRQKIYEDLDRKNPLMKKNVHIGALPVLPYFSFDDDQSRGRDGLGARSSEFLAITKSALDCYHFYQTAESPRFDVIYLLGFDKLSKMKVSAPGGAPQENEPHFIEILSALAFRHFLDLNFKEQARGCYRVKRKIENAIHWEDLTYNPELKKRLGQFLKFCFAFSSIYYPAIKEIEANNKIAYQAPWFLRLVKSDINEDGLKLLDKINNFCSCYMRWAQEVQKAAISDLNVELFNESAFTMTSTGWAVQPKLFDNLLRELKPASRPNALHSLWTSMCNSRYKQNWGSNLGPFIRALHENCRADVQTSPSSGESKHFFYPKLKKDHSIEIPGRPGEWNRNRNNEWDELKRLSEGIDVGQVDIQINSTPDMKSRLILFERALLYEDHPLHQTIRGEWRGFLALVALKDIRQYQELQEKNIDIERGMTSNIFLAALYNFLPKDEEWHKLTIYNWNDKAIAVSSPTTIVCTASDTVNRCDHGRVNWYNGIHFKNPTVSLNDQEKGKLGVWLEKIKEELRIMESKLDRTKDEVRIDQLDRLAAQISSFINNLQE